VISSKALELSRITVISSRGTAAIIGLNPKKLFSIGFRLSFPRSFFDRVFGGFVLPALGLPSFISECGFGAIRKSAPMRRLVCSTS
jgi:hypothetical protein